MAGIMLTSLRTAPRPHAQLWLLSLTALLLTLLWDATSLDLPTMAWFANAQGFPLRHEWWLERVLHDTMRQLATLLHLALVAMVFWPVGPMRQLSRWERLSVAVGVTLGLVAVNWIKRNSLTSCPWELSDFGGVAHYVSHWSWGLGDGGGGHCFPGGHASAALAFLGLPLPWLTSRQPAARAFGHQLLRGVLGLGLLLGLTQTVRGAHYPSHTLWTGLICWGVAVLNHGLFAALAQWRTRHAPAMGVT